MKKNKKIPIVAMTFQDHSADLEGEAQPFHFLAVGILQKETPLGYYLGHWLDLNNKGKGEVTTYIAKVKGMKIRVIGHIQP